MGPCRRPTYAPCAIDFTVRLVLPIKVTAAFDLGTLGNNEFLGCLRIFTVYKRTSVLKMAYTSSTIFWHSKYMLSLFLARFQTFFTIY